MRERERERDVVCMIDAARLPLYKQAAENTGYRLSVHARLSRDDGTRDIIITAPPDQMTGDFSSFWREYERLKAEQNPRKF